MKRLLALAAAIALVPVIGPGSASAGGGCHGDYVPDARGTSVKLQAMCFDALVTRVAKGANVRWTNEDDFAHNLTGAAFQWGSNVDLQSGDTIVFRFDDDGVFPYSCTIHPGMVGAVVVGTGVRGADASRYTSSVTLVGNIVSTKKGATAATPDTTSAEAVAPVAPVASPSAAAAVASAPQPPSAQAAPAPAQPPAAAAPAQPQPAAAPAQPSAAAVVPAASTNDRGGEFVAAMAIIGALILAAVAYLARRTPAQRELVG